MPKKAGIIIIPYSGLFSRGKFFTNPYPTFSSEKFSRITKSTNFSTTVVNFHNYFVLATLYGTELTVLSLFTVAN